MATEIDHDKIKEKIVAILKANATLFDANDLTKLRSIIVGFPEGDPFDPEMLDQCFVTNGNPFETITHPHATDQSALLSLKHVFNYEIVFVVNAQNAREAEEKLDDFQKLILEELEEDFQLVGVSTREVDDSLPIGINGWRTGGHEGTPIQARVITFRLFKYTS